MANASGSSAASRHRTCRPRALQRSVRDSPPRRGCRRCRGPRRPSPAMTPGQAWSTCLRSADATLPPQPSRSRRCGMRAPGVWAHCAWSAGQWSCPPMAGACWHFFARPMRRPSATRIDAATCRSIVSSRCAASVNRRQLSSGDLGGRVPLCACPTPRRPPRTQCLRRPRRPDSARQGRGRPRRTCGSDRALP